MKQSTYTLLLYTLVAIGLFASCEHKDLCYNYQPTASVRVDVDWSKFTDYETPTGMTLVFYPQSSNEETITRLTNNISQAILNLPANRYHVLAFNQSTTEFGSLSFRGMDKQETAQVVATEHKSRWYTARSQYEKTASNPEWLGVANYSGAEVTKQMLDDAAAATLSSGATTRSGQPLIASLVPQNVVHTVKVKVHLKNIYNLRSARASLNGMAEGITLATAQPLSSKVTHLMEEWTMERDPADPTMGVLEGSITCFGLPSGHQSTAEENLFTLSLLLVDNKTVMTFPFSVGDRFIQNTIEGNVEQQANVELQLLLEINADIPLADVKPEGGASGGFTADVEDWSDVEEYDINI